MADFISTSLLALSPPPRPSDKESSKEGGEAAGPFLPDNTTFFIKTYGPQLTVGGTDASVGSAGRGRNRPPLFAGVGTICHVMSCLGSAAYAS
jgi:hypothetical protein